MISAASHVGKVRPANQDAYGYSAEAQCFAVCDGMGGAAGGEVASRIAVETFLERLGPEPDPDSPVIPVARRIEQAIAAANRILFSRAQREQALHGMGTTLVALVLSNAGPASGKQLLRPAGLASQVSNDPGTASLDDPGLPNSGLADPGQPNSGLADPGLLAGGLPAPHSPASGNLSHAAKGARRRSAGAGMQASPAAGSLVGPATRPTRDPAPASPRAWIAHVGDSRCYLLRDGALRRCTRDHSLVEEQVRLGQLTPDQAATSPMRHVITRAVGVRRSVAVEVQELAIEPGDLFLLCSDGLTRELNEGRIAELLADLPEDGDYDLSQMLVDEAVAAGGADNITCLTVHVA